MTKEELIKYFNDNFGKKYNFVLIKQGKNYITTNFGGLKKIQKKNPGVEFELCLNKRIIEEEINKPYGDNYGDDFDETDFNNEELWTITPKNEQFTGFTEIKKIAEDLSISEENLFYLTKSIQFEEDGYYGYCVRGQVYKVAFDAILKEVNDSKISFKI